MWVTEAPVHWFIGLLMWALQGPQPTKNAPSPYWSMKITSRLSMPSLRGWRICMECVLAVRRLTTDLWPEATALAVILRKPLLTVNHRRLRLDCAWRWQNRLWLLGPTPSGEMSHIFSCTLSMAAWEFVNCWENASSKTARLPGFKLDGVLFMSGGHSTWVPNHVLCSWIGMTMALE